MGTQNDSFTGNDTLEGGSRHDSLNGGANTNSLTGGAGNDTFVFDNVGSTNTAADFDQLGNDVLDISAFNFGDLDDVLAAATDVGSDVTIELDGNDEVTLLGVNKKGLSGSDFAF